MQTHIEKRNKYMEGKMSKNALTPLVVHPSTTSHSSAGYPKIQNWTFIKTTFQQTCTRTYKNQSLTSFQTLETGL